MSELGRIEKLERTKWEELELLQAKEKEIRSQLQSIESQITASKEELSSIRVVKGLLSSKTIEPSGAERLDCDDAGVLPVKCTTEGSPEDWLYPRFAPMGLMEAAKIVLEDNAESALSSSDITSRLYSVEPESPQFSRARNSLSATLRRGAKAKEFRKVGRGYFQANSQGHSCTEQLRRNLGLESNGKHLELVAVAEG